MRKGWEIKKLGEVCKLTRGHNPPKSKFINEPREGYVRFYQIRDGWADDYAVYVPDSPQLHKVEPDEMLMVAYRHIGKIFRGVSGAFNVALCKISVKKRELLNDDFLFYMIPSDFVRGELLKRSERSLIPSMSVEHLKDIQIPVPPLREQQHIVSILDEAFEAIDQAKANTERNLQNARELFQSELNRIFTNKGGDLSLSKGEGWVEKKIGEVCGIMNGGTPDTKVKEFWDGDNLWITPKDMGRLTSIFVDDTERKITDAGIKNSSAKILPPDSVILSSRAPIGHLAINAKPLSTNQGCKGLIPNQNISTLYLYYFLKNSVQLLNDLGSGTTFKELSGSKLSEVIIPLPPLSEQQNIVKQLGSLSAETKQLEANYQKKLESLEELKKSILQKAFSGELTRETNEIQMEQLDMVAEDQAMYNPNQ